MIGSEPRVNFGLVFFAFKHSFPHIKRRKSSKEAGTKVINKSVPSTVLKKHFHLGTKRLGSKSSDATEECLS